VQSRWVFHQGFCGANQGNDEFRIRNSLPLITHGRSDAEESRVPTFPRPRENSAGNPKSMSEKDSWKQSGLSNPVRILLMLLFLYLFCDSIVVHLTAAKTHYAVAILDSIVWHYSFHFWNRNWLGGRKWANGPRGRETQREKWTLNPMEEALIMLCR
jgi:hypothetical protein